MMVSRHGLRPVFMPLRRWSTSGGYGGLSSQASTTRCVSQSSVRLREPYREARAKIRNRTTPSPTEPELEEESIAPREPLVSKPLDDDPGFLGEMQMLQTVQGVRDYRKLLSDEAKKVGLVPTMGALHEGHLSLIRTAAAENDVVIVSIYVNPTQFGVNEDLDKYPRTLQSDVAKLMQLNEELIRKRRGKEDDAPGTYHPPVLGEKGPIAAIFLPHTREMYPGLPPSSQIDGKGSFVTITPISNLLEGASRPVFFRGVATVCMKLFNIVQPTRAYFGQKDIQQSLVIRRMVKDFHLPLTIRVLPTQREGDGLARSSRNVYLGARRRAIAPILSRALRVGLRQSRLGKTMRSDIQGAAMEILYRERLRQEELKPSVRARFQIDYVSFADPDTMEEIEQTTEKGAILSGAIKMLPIEEPWEGEKLGEGEDKTPVRLIDNTVILKGRSSRGANVM